MPTDTIRRLTLGAYRPYALCASAGVQRRDEAKGNRQGENSLELIETWNNKDVFVSIND